MENNNSGVGLLGVLAFVAPFVAGAIDDTLVAPTIAIGLAAVAAYYVIPKIPWGSIVRNTIVPAVAVGVLSIPVLTNMPSEQGATFVAYALLIGGVWIVYKVGKRLMWG